MIELPILLTDKETGTSFEESATFMPGSILFVTKEYSGKDRCSISLISGLTLVVPKPYNEVLQIIKNDIN